MADSGRCCNRALHFELHSPPRLWHGGEKKKNLWHFSHFLVGKKEARSDAPTRAFVDARSSRVTFSVETPDRSRGLSERNIEQGGKKQTFFLDKMTLEMVAVFLSTVGSSTAAAAAAAAATCWRFRRSIFGPPRRKKKTVGRLVASTRLTAFPPLSPLPNPAAKPFCVSNSSCVYVCDFSRRSVCCSPCCFWCNTTEPEGDVSQKDKLPVCSV